VGRDLLQRRKEQGIVRGIVAELLYRYCEITQLEIGRLLGGIDYGAVYWLRRRLWKKIGFRSQLRKKYEGRAVKVRNAHRM
jgi:hypothetical protein